MIFRVVSIVLIAALLVYLFRKLKPLKIAPKNVWQFCREDFKENLVIAWRNKSGTFFQKIKSVTVHLCAALFIILFVTAFLPVVFGYHMSGLFMMIHASTALLASICLVAFVFLFSNSNQLSLEELKKLADDYRLKKTLDSQIMLKVLYWLLIALILPAMLSIILMLYPLFGTDGLEFLADVHRWSVLLLTICVIFVQYYRIIIKNEILG
ncbi:MAG: hypothetical protein WCZ90_09625 [Melioribacteraceae bacterium]